MMHYAHMLALGWLPAVVVALWEVARNRRTRRFGVEPAVSAEAVRWGLYLAAAWTIGYAALSLCWLDAQGLTASLAAAVLFTVGTTGLLLWHVGNRYCSRQPHLREMRDAAYSTRLSLVARTRKLRRLAYLGLGEQRDARYGEELIHASNVQLGRLQRALTTQAFLQRLRGSAAERAELDATVTEQRRLLSAAQHFLSVTAAVESIPCLVAEPVMVW